MIIGKLYKFDAAHFLPEHPKCGELHGHTWEVKVEIEGQVGADGMVMDFSELDMLMKGILVHFDHTNLNDTINRPTAEVLATMIWSSLQSKLQETFRVDNISVREGFGGWATFRKEKK